MKKVELLAPAGNMECFETALRFGADAIYLAGKKFGLRAFADNFTEEDIVNVVKRAHELGKKVYVTVNSLMHNDQLDSLPGYIRFLKEAGVDAAIVSDPAVIMLCREIGLELHISTQMSTMNYSSAHFWYNNGAKRVVLGREASLDEIKEIIRNIPKDLEIETFVHGAMCVAYSGRCFLSAVLTGRSGNEGSCAQPCRWKYALYERQDHPGEYFPIEQEGHESFILNSKDMMLLDHLPELIESGIASFKVEGRMKSIYYVATVVNSYRRAIDEYYKDPANYHLDERLLTDVKDSATRGFTTGFYFDHGDDSLDNERARIERNFLFCGIVTEERDSEGYVTVEQRNKFCIGDILNILAPDDLYGEEFTVTSIKDMEGLERESAPHPQEKVKLYCPFEIKKDTLLRIRLKKEE